MLSPNVRILKTLEIALPVPPPITLIPPEETRHARKRFANDHLARLSRSINRLTRPSVQNIDVHAQRAHLHFARVNGSSGIERDERGRGVGAAGRVANLHFGRERAVEPPVLVWGEGGAGGVDDAEGGEVEFPFGDATGHFDFEKVAGAAAKVGYVEFLHEAKEVFGVWVQGAAVVADCCGADGEVPAHYVEDYPGGGGVLEDGVGGGEGVVEGGDFAGLKAEAVSVDYAFGGAGGLLWNC